MFGPALLVPHAVVTKLLSLNLHHTQCLEVECSVTRVRNDTWENAEKSGHLIIASRMGVF